MTRGFKEGRDHAWRQFDDDEMTGIAARTCIKHGSRVVNRDKAAQKTSRDGYYTEEKSIPYRTAVRYKKRIEYGLF